MSDETDKADLDAVLAAGAKQVSVDGTSVQFDLDQVRKQRDELARKITPAARPRLASIDLSDF